MANSICADDADVLDLGQARLSQREAVTPAGRRRSWQSLKFRFHDVAGEPFVGTITIDITAHTMATRDAALRAQASERAHALESLAQLSGGIAHDFNNLLGVILTYVTLLERQCEDLAVLADLGEIRTAAQRGVALTKQLITFTERESAGPRELDVAAAVRNLTAMLEQALGKRIELRLELGPDPVVASVSMHELDQILLNLALNAREAMPAGGVFTIEAAAVTQGTRHSAEAVLTVRDTGIGMSPDDSARAFEPFFTTKAGGGTGLGLTTVYGIVRQNLGNISIVSAVGAGTTVTIRLPGPTEQVPVPAKPR
jgi:signal transduction histidine kinase